MNATETSLKTRLIALLILTLQAVFAVTVSPTAVMAQVPASCTDGTTGVPAGSVVLRGEYLCVGFSNAGTMGVGGSTNPGIRHSPSGNVAVNGTYDYLTPGSPYDGFAVQANNINSGNMLTNTNGGTKAFTGTLTDTSSGTTNQVTWTSTSHAAMDITNVYSFGDNDQTLKVSVTIKAKTDIVNLRYLRSMDPDAKASSGDSSTTNNALGYGSLPASDFVYTEAVASKVVLSMYSNSTVSHEAKLFTGCCSIVSPDTASIANGTGDWGIGIAFYIGNLTSGSSVVLEYEYRFAANLAAATGGTTTPNIDTAKSGGYTIADLNNGDVNATFEGGTLALSESGTVGANFNVLASNGTVSTANKNVTFSGIFSGVGGITKTGTGTMTVTGANTNTGGFTVAGGTLSQTGGSISGPVNVSGGTLNQSGGSIAGAITVSNGSSFIGNGTVTGTTTVSGTGSTLSGAGTFGNVIINSGSFHKPGNSPGTATINGNYTLAAGGTLEVEVASDGTSDKLIVNGTATLSGYLDILGYGKGFTAASYNYLVLDNDGADAIVSNFSGYRNDFAFYSVSYAFTANTGNDFLLTLTRNSQTFESVADTAARKAVGSALDSLPTSAYSSLIGLMTPAEVRAFLDTLSSEVYASGAAVLADKLASAFTDQALGGVTPFADDCAPQGDLPSTDVTALRADCIIARSFQVVATGGVREYAAGGTSATSAWQGGLEARMLFPFQLDANSHAYAGIVAAQDIGRISVGSATAETSAAGGSLVAGWRSGGLDFNAVLGTTFGHVETRRTIAGTAATGAFDLALYGGAIGVGYAFDISDTLQLRPHGALTHVVTSTNGFSETSGSGLSYSGAATTSSQTLATVGLGLTTQFELDGYIIRPRADISLTQRVAGGPSAISGTIGGSNAFTLAGADSGPTTASLGMGATLAADNGISFDADYRLDLSNAATAHSVRLGVKGSF